ncbi:MAG TPA: ROK family transcriptional regulator, partial [Ktedonobacterales bacterium]|nr:ROK family transcriptional regulator [Ktedonobacterales bacterium]
RREDLAQRGADQHHLRASNRLLVLNYVRAQRAMPRSDLARYTGLSRTTIGTIVDELVQEGIIREEAQRAGDDRRTTVLSFNASAGYVLGCSLGRHHLTMLLTDLSATILHRADIPFATTQGPAEGLPHLQEALHTFVAQQQIAWEQIMGVGLGVVGPLDPSLHMTAVPTTLSGWAGVNIKQGLEKYLGIPVYLDNNGNMGALGESRYGAGAGIGEMIYVKVGSGIAGGLILDGHLYRGSSGSAGEIGHMPVDYDGTLCHCGHFGCLETIAGSRGILTEAQRLFPSVSSITEVIQSARQGNAACLHALGRAGKYLGFALASLVNIYNPSVIVLDGSTMQAGDLVTRHLHATLEAHCLQAPYASTRLVPAACGGMAIALGGVASVLDDIFSSRYS